MPAFPSALEDLSADWLTQVLRERFPRTSVLRFELLEEQHGTNRNARLRLSYGERDGAPDVVFIKLPPAEARQRALVIATGMGRREALFYERLAHHVPMRVPTSYFSAHDDATGEFAILIEDLPSAGCRLADGVAGVSNSFAEQAMDDFAALHAAFPASRGVACGVEPLLRMPDYAVGMLEHALASRRDSLTADFCDMADLYIEAVEDIHDLWEAGEQSVVHGDGHVTNLFEDADRAGFLDWGCFSLAPPMRDVSYFLCMAQGTSQRRANEKPLIERYLARRAELGAPGPSFDEAWHQHRVHAGYTVVAAAPATLYAGGVTTADPAYSSAFVERASAAVQDLESVALLRRLLRR